MYNLNSSKLRNGDLLTIPTPELTTSPTEVTGANLLGVIKVDATTSLETLKTTYKKLEELEDSFVGKYIKCIPTDRVNNWQSVDFIFDQRVYSIEEAAGKAIKVVRRL